jgi:hypothetical protein
VLYHSPIQLFANSPTAEIERWIHMSRFLAPFRLQWV